MERSYSVSDGIPFGLVILIIERSEEFAHAMGYADIRTTSTVRNHSQFKKQRTAQTFTVLESKSATTTLASSPPTETSPLTVHESLSPSGQRLAIQKSDKSAERNGAKRVVEVWDVGSSRLEAYVEVGDVHGDFRSDGELPFVCDDCAKEGWSMTNGVFCGPCVGSCSRNVRKLDLEWHRDCYSLRSRGERTLGFEKGRRGARIRIEAKLRKVQVRSRLWREAGWDKETRPVLPGHLPYSHTFGGSTKTRHPI